MRHEDGPKAPPISAPLVGMLTLTMPQSEPDALCSPTSTFVSVPRRQAARRAEAALPEPAENVLGAAGEDGRRQALVDLVVVAHRLLKAL